MQLQLWWPSRTHDSLPARSGHPERMEITLLQRNTPGFRNISPPWEPRRGIGREHNPIHTEPTFTRLPRNKKQIIKTLANHATRRHRKERRQHRNHKLTRRAPPVNAANAARPGCSPPSGQKNACPSTSPKRVAGIATRDIPYKTKLTKTLSKKTPAPQPYIPPKLGKSEKN